MENNDPGAAGANAQSNTGDGADNELEILTRQLAECEAKLAEMRDTVLRERAELDNQRKRLQRDLEQARKFANEKLLADLLPVLDNLERGLALEGNDYAGLRGGVELTQRELVRVAEANGLKAVGTIGEAFNPEHHQAMAMVEAAGQGAGRIVAVMQKGYVLNERLLRPALVSVSK
ncbi:nucleotide exchange factor GrpE [Dokdonella sp.]|uniref:nucleotide exchange factor GrpE n=1 Tax=Dokdonella sp. TaxID=2291710 RepID=UPI001B29F12D|nr:nucleotide exchange factor GrpE [Dokdonella sp.]MBO9662611.1 nucleotide exchange factor GrpE [Dokdonella sp.]